MKNKLKALIAFSLLLGSCIPDSAYEMSEEFSDYDLAKLPYQLNVPDTTINLHWDLEETSALAYYKDNVLLTVEDERGKVYFIDAQTGEIIRTIKFEKGGDYEGVEVKNDSIWVMESNGDFFYFSASQEDAEVQRFKSSFKSSNNLEGLGLLDNKLLVACKGDGDTEGINQKGKGIYLVGRTSIQPYLFIQRKELRSFIEDRKYFNQLRDFDPSGIAVHPLNGDIYILSADRVLVVYDKNLKLKEVAKLTRRVYHQPEGICFSPDGTLYISSEGGGDKGELAVIKMVSHDNNGY